MNWFLRDGYGPHAGRWITFVLVIGLLFALCIVLFRLVFGLSKRKGDRDVSESDYWRIHGG